MWAAEITLVSDTDLSTEGYFVLSWNSEEGSQSPVLLQQSSTDRFNSPREFTLPANSSITITGLTDGQYFFRAREDGSPFGNTVIVDVAHHSLQRALFFFSVGLALFLVLVITIIQGNRSLRETPEEGDDAS